MGVESNSSNIFPSAAAVEMLPQHRAAPLELLIGQRRLTKTFKTSILQCLKVHSPYLTLDIWRDSKCSAAPVVFQPLDPCEPCSVSAAAWGNHALSLSLSHFQQCLPQWKKRVCLLNVVSGFRRKPKWEPWMRTKHHHPLRGAAVLSTLACLFQNTFDAVS